MMPDLPYYSNVGDLLIWEGMECFLKDNSSECLWRTSISTFEYKELPEDVTICLVGGGNFGDLWRELQRFKNRIVKLYPNNRIVIFPQSVFYGNPQLCKEDAAAFSAHRDVHICARDKDSYDFLKENFTSCDILLVPDMALYLDFDKVPTKTDRTLFLKRNDKESVDYSVYDTEGMDVSDWPMHQSGRAIRWSIADRVRHKLLRVDIGRGDEEKELKRLERKFLSRHTQEKSIAERWVMADNERAYLSYLNKQKFPHKLNEVIDWFMQTFYRPLSIQYGVDFINQYDVIYATRLHAAILGLLLGKEVHLIDNSYGKMTSFYDTWLVRQK